MEKLIECPDCKGSGGDDFAIDITEYVECPTCEGLGVAKEGTKSWLQKLMDSKLWNQTELLIE